MVAISLLISLISTCPTRSSLRRPSTWTTAPERIATKVIYSWTQVGRKISRQNQRFWGEWIQNALWVNLHRLQPHFNSMFIAWIWFQHGYCTGLAPTSFHFQWRIWGGAMGAIAPPPKGVKKEKRTVFEASSGDRPPQKVSVGRETPSTTSPRNSLNSSTTPPRNLADGTSSTTPPLEIWPENSTNYPTTHPPPRIHGTSSTTPPPRNRPDGNSPPPKFNS